MTKLPKEIQDAVDTFPYTLDADELLDTVGAEFNRLNAWIQDLLAGTYINCVYCGHRYGPDTDVPAAMSQVLYDHVQACPKHPLSAAKAENSVLKSRIAQLEGELDLVVIRLQYLISNGSNPSSS